MIHNLITDIIIYDASFIVGFGLLLTQNLLRCKTFHISRARAIVYSFLTLLSGGGGAMLAATVYNALAAVKGVIAGVNVDQTGALVLVPPFMAAAVGVEKWYLKRRQTAAGGTKPEQAKTVSYRDTMDLIIPGCFVLLSITKIGCHFRGCCYGVECGWGIYFPNRDITLFPVQIFECVTTLLILITTYCVQHAGFFRRGMSLPFGAGLFALARFFWEFYRYYVPEMRHFALGLTFWQIVSLLLTVVFAVWFTVLYRTRPAEPLPKGLLPKKAETKKPDGKRITGKVPQKGKAGPARAAGKKKNPAAKHGEKKR